MGPWARYGIGIASGLLLGIASAVWSVRAGAIGTDAAIGPWRTGTDFASADQGSRARAVIALRGLMALPADEARYYFADVDDAGAPLDGRCAYRVEGGALPARWWSLTVYGEDGFLVGRGPHSVQSAALGPDERDAWTVHLGPGEHDGHWLSTAGRPRFNLILRTYLPDDAGRTTPSRDELPGIAREACP